MVVVVFAMAVALMMVMVVRVYRTSHSRIQIYVLLAWSASELWSTYRITRTLDPPSNNINNTCAIEREQGLKFYDCVRMCMLVLRVLADYKFGVM